MKAVTWHGRRDVRVEEVPDATLQEPTDAVVRMTTTGLCGSDLHLYEVLGPFMNQGDILGHEPMGIVEEVGSAVTSIAPGDRVVMPFQISCGTCWFCRQGLQTQCETTQVREQGMGAALYGYTELYGAVPGAQAELLRVPFADYNPIKVPEGPPDDRFVYLSDVLPTAWQAVAYADVPEDGTVLVLGARADRRHERPDSPAPGSPRDRSRPGAGATRARPAARCGDHRSQRARERRGRRRPRTHRGPRR